jgi:hypothetical protein
MFFMGSNKYINQEIYMYYLVIVDHSSMAAHLTSPEVNVKIFKCCISSATDGTDML